MDQIASSKLKETPKNGGNVPLNSLKSKQNALQNISIWYSDSYQPKKYLKYISNSIPLHP